VADGLFLGSDILYVMPDIDLQPLIELFKVSGFSVHNRVSVKADLAVSFAIFCGLVDIKPASM